MIYNRYATIPNKKVHKCNVTMLFITFKFHTNKTKQSKKPKRVYNSFQSSFAHSGNSVSNSKSGPYNYIKIELYGNFRFFCLASQTVHLKLKSYNDTDES